MQELLTFAALWALALVAMVAVLATRPHTFLSKLFRLDQPRHRRPHRSTKRLAVVAALMALVAAPSMALAQVNGLNGITYSRVPNIREVGTATPTANSTFSTTSFALLPGATVTYVPSRDPNQLWAPGEPVVPPHLHLFFNAEASKATATYGACEFYYNGALVPATARQITSAAGSGDLTIVADVTETVSGSQSVQVWCASGDTNTFTVVAGTLLVEEIF